MPGPDFTDTPLLRADAVGRTGIQLRARLGFFWGTFLEPIDAFATSDGATITMTLEQTGGGDLTMDFSDGLTRLDCTPACTVELTPGTDEEPVQNFVYILQSTKALTVSTDNWPAAEHIRVCHLVLPSASLVNTGAPGNNFVYGIENINDEASDLTGQGHLCHIMDWARHRGAKWHKGAEGVATQDGNDLWVSIAEGTVAQIHHHTFAELNSDTVGAGDPILVINDPDAAYTIVQSLNSITKLSGGDNIGVNKYVKFVLIGIANKTGSVSPMMLNVPAGEYNSVAGAVIDVEGHANFTIPRAHFFEAPTGFLVAAFVCKHTASAMEIEQTIDLRGSTPFNVSGGGTGGGDVTAAAVLADDAIVTGDGGAKGVQTGDVLIDASNNITGVVGLTAVTITPTTIAASVDVLNDVDTTSDAPDLNEVLKWDGSNWVPGTAGVTDEFTFTIDTFAGTETDSNQLIGAGTWVASGAMSFSATYSNAPGGMTALVTMTGTATGWSTLVMDPVTGAEPTVAATSYPASPGDTVTFTLTQNADGSSAIDTVQFNNTMRYGANNLAQGNQDTASLEALAEVSGPNESRSQTIHNIANDGNYVTFAYATRLTAVSDIEQIRINTGLGYVTAAFAAAATTLKPDLQTAVADVDNSAGYSENVDCVTSLIAGLADGSNDFQLSGTSAASNYIFWGELNKASGYTEADVEDNIADEPGQVVSNLIDAREMTVNAAGGEYTYIAYPARLGALTSIIIGGFESIGDFTVDSTTLAITNDGGYQENYRVYVSNNPGFADPTTMTVSI